MPGGHSLLVHARQTSYDSVVGQLRPTPIPGMFRAMNLRSVVLIIVLGLGILGFGVASLAVGQAALSLESGQCPADSSAHADPAGAAHRHCVKLTWRASVPASKLSRDKVIGYNVYRSQTPHDSKAKQINPKIITGTTYTDTDVKLGTVYFYVVRGLSKMAKSDPSNEVRAEIPPQ